MNTLDFLRLILPSSGIYFAATPLPGGGYRHFACESIEELAAKCIHLDAQGEEVFYALSSFNQADVVSATKKDKRGRPKITHRTKDNVKLVKAFWLDMDVGTNEPGKPAKYPDQKAAIAALLKFCEETSLPIPLIVSSGYGVHAYWPITEPMMPGQWDDAALDLKALTQQKEMLVDPVRTSDRSSVLRPIGTTNRKVKNGVAEGRAVYAFNSVTAFETNSILASLQKALGKKEPRVPTAKQKFEGAVNAGLTVQNEFPPSSAHQIAEKCNQIRLMRDLGGKVSEPHWYHALQLLQHTIEGKAVCHQWSAGDERYTFADTEAKIEQAAGMGPTLCATFELKNPDGCKGCPFKGHISTPLALGVQRGTPEPVKIKAQDDQGNVIEIVIPEPDWPFSRGGKDNPGLFIEVEGVPIKFYSYDLFPISLEVDEGDKIALTKIKHWLPKEGWCEFTLPFHIIQSQMDFPKEMAKNSVMISAMGEYRDAMRIYLANYIQKMQQTIKQQVHYASFGWKDGGGFVVGNRLYTPEGVRTVGISSKVEQTLAGFEMQGDLQTWSNVTKELDKPGYDPYKFTLMLGFGAPLMSFTEYNGLLVNLTGETSRGKSTMGAFMMSIYNKHDTKSSNNSTMQARFAKMGAYAHLPMYIDEITRNNQKELSNIVYDIANGAAREALKRDRSQAHIDYWKTIVLSSSNLSIYAVLSSGHDMPEAQMMRCFEFTYPDRSETGRTLMDFIIKPVIRENYGVAGDAYIRWLVKQDRADLAAKIEAVSMKLEEMAASPGSIPGAERFWTHGAATSIVGAGGAYAQGIIQFNPFEVMPWIAQQIKFNRGVSSEATQDSEALLASYINATVSERLIFNKVGKMRTLETTRILNPKQITQRWDIDRGLLWIEGKAISAWLAERNVNPKMVREQLRLKGILTHHRRPVRLGADTIYAAPMGVKCWEIKQALDVNNIEVDETKPVGV